MAYNCKKGPTAKTYSKAWSLKYAVVLIKSVKNSTEEKAPAENSCITFKRYKVDYRRKIATANPRKSESPKQMNPSKKPKN
jgi:hypothetical protein